MCIEYWLLLRFSLSGKSVVVFRFYIPPTEMETRLIGKTGKTQDQIHNPWFMRQATEQLRQGGFIVVRIIDRPYMTSAVYHGCKTTNQPINHKFIFTVIPFRCGLTSSSMRSHHSCYLTWQTPHAGTRCLMVPSDLLGLALYRYSTGP